MNFILICLGVAVVCFIVAALLPKQKTKTLGFYSVYTPNGLKLIKQMELMVQENKTMRYLGYFDLYKQLTNEDVSKDLSSFEKAIGILGYDEEPENSLKSIAGQYLDDLQWVLAHRHRNEVEELYKFDEAEAMTKFGINIHSDEYVHEYANKGVDWFEEKTITTSINYGGYRFNSGGQGLHYTMGSLNVMKNTRTYFNHIDRGSLYITNKRIIFIGKEKKQNRTIDLEDILEFELFRNGLLIGKSNGKKPLIEFAPYLAKPNLPSIPRDHLNRIVRALKRVINRTQFSTLNA